MNRDNELLSGYVIGQRYQLEERIGRTRYADVWRGLDKGSGSEVALKVLAVGHDEQYSEEMFFREVSALQTLRHPNVVTLLDRGRDEGTRRPYLVEEYMPGG